MSTVFRRASDPAAILGGMASCLGRTIVLLLVVALVRPAAGIGALGSDPGGRRIVMLGRSVDGRPIIAVERRFARLTGMRLARLAREPGSVVGWTNHQDAAGTAFVVELPAGKLNPTAVSRYVRAVIALAAPPGSNAKAG